MFCGNFTLTRFDGIITKFDNLAAVEANQVIVVMLLCQFKYGFTAFKIEAVAEEEGVQLTLSGEDRRQDKVLTHQSQIHF